MTTHAKATKRVFYEDTDESREVVGYCKVCRVDPDRWPPMVVSPQGVVHEADYGTTLCGKDATGEDWWWHL